MDRHLLIILALFLVAGSDSPSELGRADASNARLKLQSLQVPFGGRALAKVLEESATVACSADQAAVTGYYAKVQPGPGEPKTVLTSEAVRSQTTGGGYRIAFAGNQASVLDEVMKLTSEFRVHSRRADGVVLYRAKEVGVETITIDPRTGSFLFTDATVTLLSNRANVWVGRCW